MTERHDPYVSLRNPNYRWYVASLVAFTMGTQIQATVVAWQVYAITKDPLSLGLVGLAEALPFIGAALYAGHVADRHDRKNLSMVALAVQALCVAALLSFTLRPEVLAAGRVWPIFGAVFASGLARSFLQPARTALGAEIVPREIYANAIAWRSSLWQFAAVIGPAAGGMLYGFSGPRAAYATAMAFCAVAFLLFARIAYTRRPVAAQEGTIGENLTMGIRFLLTQPVLLGAQLLDLFSVLFGGRSRCCRSSRRSICTSVRRGSACCAPRPRPAPSRCRYSSPIESCAERGRLCCSASLGLVSAGSSSRSRGASGCRSRCW
jgi:MFS family permease